MEPPLWSPHFNEGLLIQVHKHSHKHMHKHTHSAHGSISHCTSWLIGMANFMQLVADRRGTDPASTAVAGVVMGQTRD